MAVNGAWIAAAVGATASVAGAVQAQDTSRRAKNTAADAERAKAQAEVDASNNANARVKMQRQAMSQNSLLTGGGSSSGTQQTLGV